MANDLFTRMCKEAQDEIASGEKGWKEADTNTLLLACFGLLTNHLTHSLARPLWCAAGMISAGVVTWIVMVILNSLIA